MRKVTDTEKHIILGSASPRRRELLSGLGLEFEVDTRNCFEEKYSPDTPHRDIPLILSKGKSHGFHRPLSENEVLITADTLVLCGEEIMGKPHSEEEARQMLKHLSGREHEVITGVTIRDAFREKSFADRCLVRFAPLSEEDIDFYIKNFKPFDKAGAYGIQEWIGYAAISGITGSFFTVVGLPTQLLYYELKSFL